VPGYATGKIREGQKMKEQTKSMKNRNIVTMLATGLLACFGFLPQTNAAPEVAPPPDGCYPGFTTAEGCQALQNLTTGSANTGVGFRALFSAGASSFNTGVGAGALVLNTGDSNTAVGTLALLLNTDGGNNTAVGVAALENNSTGNNNTANGAFALFANTSGAANTAVGRDALVENATGSFNTALGHGTLHDNLASDSNTAVGFFALHDNVAARNTAVGQQALDVNTIGQGNVAVGFHSLFNNIIGGGNVAIGTEALLNSTAGFNIAIGAQAGSAITTAHDVTAINSPGGDVNDSTFIGNIRGVTTDLNDTQAVLIDSAGQLGTINSSRRFKTDIKPMDKTSESILALKPVSFRYKVHRDGPAQFGLIAEDVAEVNCDLVIYDSDGKPQTVRYEAVNAMLLNEFLKAHNKMEAQDATIAELKSTVAQQQKGMEALTAQVEKVSAQIQVNQAAPQLTANND
jgi:hypothetical protein